VILYGKWRSVPLRWALTIGDARNLKLGRGLRCNMRATARAQGAIFMCGPNVDLIQLLCALKDVAGFRGRVVGWKLRRAKPSWR